MGIAILLTRGKHLVSRGRHVWVMQTTLTGPLFIFKCQNHPRIVISHERVSISLLVSVTLLEHLSSPPVFNEVRVTRSLDLSVCFVDFCTFVLFHCVVCSSSIYSTLTITSSRWVTSFIFYLLFII